MGQETPTAWELTQRLVAREATTGAAPGDAAAVALAACERAHHELARWLGPAGCHALFARALVQARATHGALAGIRVRERSEPALDGVAESIAAQGGAAVARGLEALLTAVLELLGRLVGPGMAARLVGPDATDQPRNDGTPEPGSAKP